jgi:hypothetical protein
MPKRLNWKISGRCNGILIGSTRPHAPENSAERNLKSDGQKRAVLTLIETLLAIAFRRTAFSRG